MTDATYTVDGMSCEHCVRSVEEEVGEIAGVQEVSVDLETGGLRLRSDRDVGVEEVRAAVEEAGYALSG